MTTLKNISVKNKLKNKEEYDIESLDDIEITEEIDNDEEYFHKVKRFRFYLLSNRMRNAEADASSNVSFEELDISAEKYELLKILEYGLNYFENKLNNFKRGILQANYEYVTSSLVVQMIYWFNSFKLSCLKKYKKDVIEDTINSFPCIQKMIEDLNNNNRDSIDAYLLSMNKKYFTYMEEVKNGILTEVKHYLKENSKNALKRTFFINNLYTYFDLLNIKDIRIKKLAELLCILKLKGVQNDLPAVKDIQIYLGKSSLSTVDIEKYTYILFSDYKNENNIIPLLSSLVTALNKKYKNLDEFKSVFISKITKSSLSAKDFNYISSYQYIFWLLESAIKKKHNGINILLYGKPGTGKTALAKALINDLNVDGYEVKGTYTSFTHKINPESFECNNVNRRYNLCILQNMLKTSKKSIILYDEAEDFFRKKDEDSQSKYNVNDILENNNIPVIWTTNDLYCMDQSFLRRFTYTLNLDSIPTPVYIKILNKLCEKYNVSFSKDLFTVFEQYKPSLGITEKVLKNYSCVKIKRESDLKEDLLNSLQSQNYGEKLTKPILNDFTFNSDLVNTTENIQSLIKDIKNSGRLDFSMLLYGVPGTSKTSTCRYIAEQLGLKIINKNYTELSSMYVGETEKKIKALFEEAEREKAFIIIDECDVLLQNRNKANRSWEISQTEALLTCMENHPYPFAMTTNLYENLDQAVMRRILYKLKFDYLSEKQVKLAFKHFFNIDIKEKLYLSKLTSGDFALIKKQASFKNKLKDKEWLISKLTEEMNNKRDISSQKNIKL